MSDSKYIPLENTPNPPTYAADSSQTLEARLAALESRFDTLIEESELADLRKPRHREMTATRYMWGLLIGVTYVSGMLLFTWGFIAIIMLFTRKYTNPQ
ncbi:hypothetical protein CJU89_4081 [Yarrowia sp. B02]|nr:hypothetical protein CJU89_4081 [Yarrowia sp. B02]